MKAGKVVSGTVIIIFFVFAGNLSWADGGFRERKKRQVKRMEQDVRRGEMTGRDAFRLKQAQKKSLKAKKIFRRDGRIATEREWYLDGKHNAAKRPVDCVRHNSGGGFYKIHPCDPFWYGQSSFRTHKKHHRYSYKRGGRAVFPGSAIAGFMIQPEWSFTWSIRLD